MGKSGPIKDVWVNRGRRYLQWDCLGTSVENNLRYE